jgi:hypothetical protein
MPPCSPFGARMRWPEPAYTEQSQARQGAPDEGRCRADPHCTCDGGGRHNHHSCNFCIDEQRSGGVGKRRSPCRSPSHRVRTSPRECTRHEAHVVFASTEIGEVGHFLQRGDRQSRGELPQRGGLLEGVAVTTAAGRTPRRPRGRPARCGSARCGSECRRGQAGTRCPRRSGRVGFGCLQYQHTGLGLHPSARVRRQLRRVQRRGLPVRAGNVGRPDRPRHAGAGLAAGRAGRCCAEALRRTRLGALDHPVRLRPLEGRRLSPLRTWPSLGPCRSSPAMR